MRTGSQRRHTTAIFLGGTALGSTGMIASIAVGAIAGDRILGHPTWSGAPMSGAILGTALGTAIWSWLLTKRSVRSTLAVAYSTGSAGGALALTGAALGNFALLLVGMISIGVANGANQLARYLTASLYSEARRARAISWVVWMGTVAALVGPSLLGPMGDLAQRWHIEPTAGPYAAVIVTFGLTALLYATCLRRPLEHSDTAQEDESASTVSGPRSGWLARAASNRGLQLALVAMIVGQAVMTFLMTMTPLHLHGHGHGLGRVGFVISSHVVGMFGLSPLVGSLVDRAGPRRIIPIGVGLMALAASGAAFDSNAGHTTMAFYLFLLGVGWNCGFVSGSTLLSASADPSDRTRIQGLGDSIVWVSSATSSLLSSMLFATLGLGGLGKVSLALLAVPLIFLFASGVAPRGNDASPSVPPGER